MVGGLCDVDYFLGASIADRSSAEGGLAEPASAGTASHNLDADAFLDGLGEGDDGAERRGGVFEVIDDGVFKLEGQVRCEGFECFYLRVFVVEAVKGGDVGEVEFFCYCEESLFFWSIFFLCFFERFGEPDDSVFGFTEYEEVDEFGYWFAAICHTTASDYEGVIFTAVSTAQFDFGEVEHIEDVGVAKFICEAEADDIEAFEVCF